MNKGSEGFKPRSGRACPDCIAVRKQVREGGSAPGPIGRVYQAASWAEDFEQVALWGCDVCEASWEVRKNRGLVEVLTGSVCLVDMKQRRPYTFVDVSVAWEGKRYDDIGFSKVCVPDEWSPEKGIEVAMRHAVEHIVQENKLRLPVRPKQMELEGCK